MDHANLFDASAGPLISYRIITYEGVETCCNGSGNCTSRNHTFSTARGYDNMTGLCAPGTSFVTQLGKL